MKKLHKLIKLSITFLAILFAITTNVSALGIAYEQPRIVVFNTTFEGVQSVNGCLDGASENISGVSLKENNICQTISSPQQLSLFTPNITLYYQNAPGYQNARCTANEIPKASGESFEIVQVSQGITTIVCTAEPIPEPEPEPEPEPITASTTFNVNLAETIEFSNLPTSVELSITPSPNGTFKSSSLDITLGSNYKNGYSLFMNTDSTDLTNSTTTATLPTLPTTTSDYSLDNFTINHWGYSTDNTIFHPVLASQLLDSTSAPTNSRTSTVHLGAKIDITQPNGSYAGHIIFVAIPNIITE